jgi:site-specific DNA-methyltransferase (adenine-specific)
LKASGVAQKTESQTLETPKSKKQPQPLRALRDKPKPYYEAKGVKLYCADYREILPTLNAGFVDSIITDPPYAITNLAWDRAIDWPRFWTEAETVTRPTSPIVLFASGKFVNLLINTNPKNFRYDLIWEKNLAVGFLSANQRPLRSHENILIFARRFKGSTYNPQMVLGKSHKTGGTGRRPRHYGGIAKLTPAVQTNLYHPRSVLRFPNRGAKRSLHPTQKNLELMEWLVRTYSRRGETIVEPFAGSGSTAVAAIRNGRKVIAVEQSEEHCEIAARRLEAGE